MLVLSERYRSRFARVHFGLTALLLFPTLMQAARYGAEDLTSGGLQIVKLIDHEYKTEVSILVSVGNNAFDMKVNGKPVFWSPYADIKEQKTRPQMLGNPFLAPWANRLDHEGFYFNGKHYPLNPGYTNYRKDNHGQPIHGLIVNTNRWEVKETRVSSDAAWVTSRIDMWKYPDIMAHFPFAHSIEMTYRLHDGALEVETAVFNHSHDAMPLSIAFHPYFQVTDAPRDEWTVKLPAKHRVELTKTLVPSGERTPNPHAGKTVSLKGIQLDDVFDGVDGDREFSVTGKQQKVSVVYGPKYPVSVVYAPAGRPFICFEPMTGVTNAFNLNHAGKYPELQTVPANGVWRESFWVKASGF